MSAAVIIFDCIKKGKKLRERCKSNDILVGAGCKRDHIRPGSAFWVNPAPESYTYSMLTLEGSFFRTLKDFNTKAIVRVCF